MLIKWTIRVEIVFRTVNGSLFDKLKNLRYKPINTHLDELSGLLSIRHCFAHEFGRITSRQVKNIHQFHQDLIDGNFVDESGITVKPYFTIAGDYIELLPGIFERLRIITWNIVSHLDTCGLDISKDK